MLHFDLETNKTVTEKYLTSKNSCLDATTQFSVTQILLLDTKHLLFSTNSSFSVCIFTITYTITHFHYYLFLDVYVNSVCEKVFESC